MFLRCRCIMIVVVVAGVLLVARAGSVVDWLYRAGLIPWARQFEGTYLTGTALTILAALLFLFLPARVRPAEHPRSICGVCGREVYIFCRYCGHCGSRL